MAVVLAAALCFGGAWAYEVTHQDPTYGWYTADPSASEFTVSSGSDLRGLAELVNGTADVDADGTPEPAVSFEGKVVRQQKASLLSVGVISLGNAEFTPIGTPEHPFQGTFVGGGDMALGDIRRLTITQGSAYVGLFGYCGEHAVLKDICISDSAGAGAASAIQLADEDEADVTDDAVIHDVGSIVGYNAGRMENCTSRATVSVTSNREATDDVPLVVANIGGLAGTNLGDASGCSYAADLTVVAPSLASNTSDAVVANVGGIAGTQGAVTADGRSSASGTVSNCTNGFADDSGEFNMGGFQTSIHVVTTGVAARDRFGIQKEATSASVGGIVGYSYGSLNDCSNYGLVNTNCTSILLYKDSRNLVHLVSADDSIPESYPHAEGLLKEGNGGVGVGGIVGTARASGMGLSAIGRADVGMSSAEMPITMCFNVGMVAGLANVGGIAGNTGSNSYMMNCRNGKPDTASGTGTVDDCGHVVSTRWNKPMTGGIAGTASCDISNCANLSEVENIQTGYYTAGIVGSVRSPGTSASEVYACFNAGQVHVASYATQTYREAGLVGNNGGYLHDCVMRSGSVLAHDDEDTTYPNAAIGDDNWGMWSNVRFASTDELRKSSSAAVLNASHVYDALDLPEESWAYWYIAGNGYPTLNVWDKPAERFMLTSDNVEAACVQLAEFAGDREAIPQVVASVSKSAAQGGTEKVTLVQNVDFYVVPQEGAKAMTAGTSNEVPYKASIVGIGNYQGLVRDVCSYGIGACDLSSCDVIATPRTYNFGVPVFPEDVFVVSPSGGRVNASEFRYEIYARDVHSLISSNSKNYVVYDSDGFVSWDGGATLESVSSDRAHALLAGDLSGVDFVLYNADGLPIFRVVNGTSTVVDPDNNVDVPPPTEGPLRYKGMVTGVSGGGLPGYIVKATARDSAQSVKPGSWQSGQFVIEAIDLNNDCDIVSVSVEVPDREGAGTESRTWQWSHDESILYETDIDGVPVQNADGTLKRASVDFTGGQISPVVAISYTKPDGTTVQIPENRTESWYHVYGDPYTTSVSLDYVNRDATPISEPVKPAETADAAAQSVYGKQKALYDELAEHEKAAVVIRSTTSHCFSNYLHMYFAINPVDIGECSIMLGGRSWDVDNLGELHSFAYRNGYAVRPSVTLTRCGNTLIEGVDYEVVYDNNVERTAEEAIQAYEESGGNDVSGLASFTVIGLGNVTGSYTGYFIVADGQSFAELGLKCREYGALQYNFNLPVQPAGGFDLLKSDGTPSGLIEGVDYEVTYVNNESLGARANVYVRGINKYTGLLTSSFVIMPFDMNDSANAWRISDFMYSDASYTLDGVPAGVYPWLEPWRQVRPVIDWGTAGVQPIAAEESFWRVGAGAKSFVNELTGETFSWDPDDPTNATAGNHTPIPPGKYTVTESYRAGLTGSASFEMTVSKIDLAKYATSFGARFFSCESQTFTGEALCPTVSLSSTDFDNRFDITYSDNVNAGTAKYYVSAKPDDEYYRGTFVGTFEINALDIADCDVVINDQRYTGQAVEPNVVVSHGDMQLVAGRDFDVEFADNVRVGTGTAIVTGKGNCSGKVSVTFSIAQRLDIGFAEVEPIADKLYTGNPVEVHPVVVYDGNLLREGVDYTVGWENNTAISTKDSPAKVKITGISSAGSYYNGTKSIPFNIVPVIDLSAAQVVIDPQVYTGNAIEPIFDVVFDGHALERDVDYTVEYRRNVKAGRFARAIVTGIGSYMGTLNVPFDIIVTAGEVVDASDSLATLDAKKSSSTADEAAAFSVSMAEQAYPDGAAVAFTTYRSDYGAQLAVNSLAATIGGPLFLADDTGFTGSMLGWVRENGVSTIYVAASSSSDSERLASAIAEQLPDVAIEVVGSGAENASTLSVSATVAQQEFLPELERGNLLVIAPQCDMVNAASASALAAAKHAPLLLANVDGTLSDDALTMAALYQEVVIVGSAVQVDASIDFALRNTPVLQRLEGVDSYAVSARVVQYAVGNGVNADGAIVCDDAELSRRLSAIGLAGADNVAFAVITDEHTDAISALIDAAAPPHMVRDVTGDLEEEIMSALGWR